MPSPNTHIRPARQADLEAVNRVIEAVVMTWNLPQRVKRLSLPSYRYTPLDFDHLEIVVAEDDQHNVIGIAAWKHASAKDTPAEHTAADEQLPQGLHGSLMRRNTIRKSCR